MTPEERAASLLVLKVPPYWGWESDAALEAAIARQIREAVLAERERIALLAGAVKASYYVHTPLRSGAGESVTSAPFADLILRHPA